MDDGEFIAVLNFVNDVEKLQIMWMSEVSSL